MTKELQPEPKKIKFETPAEVKGFKGYAELESTNIEFSEGVKGSITFSKLDDPCLAVYGILLRCEEINVLSTPTVRTTPFQSIQLLYGEPQEQTYQFYFPLPKNYCCETVVKKKGPFNITFMFAFKVVLRSGHILNQKVPITVFRKKLRDYQEIDSEDEK